MIARALLNVTSSHRGNRFHPAVVNSKEYDIKYSR